MSLDIATSVIARTRHAKAASENVTLQEQERRLNLDVTIDYSDYDEQPRRPKSKKDTRRWCKGKVGREHHGAIIIPKNHYSFAQINKRDVCFETVKFSHWEDGKRVVVPAWSCGHSLVCVKCGKHLEWRSKICPFNVKNLEMYW